MNVRSRYGGGIWIVYWAPIRTVTIPPSPVASTILYTRSEWKEQHSTTFFSHLQYFKILSLSLLPYLYNCSHRKKAILQANNDPYNSACVSAIEKETTLTMLLDSGGQIERLIITNGGNYSNMRHHKFIYIFAIHIIYRSNQNNLHNNKIMSYGFYTSYLGAEAMWLNTNTQKTRYVLNTLTRANTKARVEKVKCTTSK